MNTETAKKSGPPKIVTSNRAFTLGEQWVNSMSQAADDEPVKAETECRSLRLGLGAKVSRQIKPANLNDPIARKLLSNLEAGKKKATKENEKYSLAAVKDDDSEDELESRSGVGLS
ncbi:hypothetical protein SAY87_011592 [Trapa incisa]|uniref:Uncharacterized protein n=2 Tax=Trapa TaxID=22665 RepID=A0AAN7R705_TRANT|nr:hypothetical protein SAY87_011592 [Trapa incisa]KAK4794329.1 hypothetical protein SAY86_012323 [Trapa natans]